MSDICSNLSTTGASLRVNLNLIASFHILNTKITMAPYFSEKRLLRLTQTVHLVAMVCFLGLIFAVPRSEVLFASKQSASEVVLHPADVGLPAVIIQKSKTDDQVRHAPRCFALWVGTVPGHEKLYPHLGDIQRFVSSPSTFSLIYTQITSSYL